MNNYDVVIAGGGFAGVYCARALGRALGRTGEMRVALIAERNVLVFQPMLAEVAGSSLTPFDVVNPLRQFCRNVDVLQGHIDHIDWASRRLTLDGGRFTRNHEVRFKHLVVAMGSVTDLSRVPGMAEYGWPMKSVADALRLRAAVINRLEEANLIADPAVRARLLTIVIVGGGYTGVETAGQLLDLVKGAQRYYANLRSTPIRVVLVHSHAHLLAEIGPELGDYAQKVLERRGIELRLGARVAEVTESRVILADATVIEAHTVVSTIGNAPHPVVLDLCRQLGVKTEGGRVPTDTFMRVTGQTELWAAGDGAAVPWNDRGTVKTAPPTAQLALRMGSQLGANLVRSLRSEALKPFTYRYMGQLATIGEREAVAEVLGLRFSGVIAWFMWRTIYLAKLPGTLRKLRVMIDWTFELIFPRDLSLVLPPPEDLLRAIHLGVGESLSKRGVKCRAFFYVRAGRVTVHTPGEPDREYPSGTIIDETELDAEGCWRGDAIAASSSGVIAIRGRALQLVRHELKLSPRMAQKV